ncbi:MAG: helix-turn-helix transcriptional regulator [Bacillota bacterium]|nr:helix-turn-helix transcriptional regulator [Bacillota bacterium]
MANKTKKIPFAKLKGLRAERRLSMADMAKIVGISEGSYLMKENAIRDFKYSEMLILRKYFKISADELFFG